MVKAIIEKEHYQTKVSSGNNQLIVDEPLANGGLELGFPPAELLAASLASCTCITLRMYSDRKQWDTGVISVTVDIQKEIHIEATRFERQIQFTGNLDDEQKQKLLEIADRCPVHKILSQKILINTLI